MPYLNRVTDYNFIDKNANFIMTRFLNALVRHICDTGCRVGDGFMLFALKVDPSVIKDIINYDGNASALTNALINRGYPAEAAQIVAMFPAKFLWPELMAFWKGKTPDVIRECS